MIIDGQKWACQKCIKGHRSSVCNHEDRELSIVRPKGRPSTQCTTCRVKRMNGEGSHSACQCRMPEGASRKKRRLLSEGADSEAAMFDDDSRCTCEEGGECICCKPSSSSKPRAISTSSAERSLSSSISRTSQSPDLSPVTPEPGMAAPTGCCGSKEKDGYCEEQHAKTIACDTTQPTKPSSCCSSKPSRLPTSSHRQPPMPPRSTISSNENVFTSDPLRALLQAVDIRLECDCGDDCACPGCPDQEHGGSDRTRPQKTASSCPTRCESCSACGLGLNLPFSGIETVDKWLADDHARAQLQAQGESLPLPDGRLLPASLLASLASGRQTHTSPAAQVESASSKKQLPSISESQATPTSQQPTSPAVLNNIPPTSLAHSPPVATPDTLAPTPSALSPSNSTVGQKMQLHGGVLNEMDTSEAEVHAELVLLHPSCTTCADVVRRKGVGVLTRS